MGHHSTELVCDLCEDKLKLAKEELVNWFHDLKARHPNVHVSTSYRNQSDQEEAFSDGTSHLHFPLSAHNKLPSEAIDIFQLDDKGIAVFDPIFCSGIAKEILAAKLPIICGMVFRSLGDYNHFQFNPHADT